MTTELGAAPGKSYLQTMMMFLKTDSAFLGSVRLIPSYKAGLFCRAQEMHTGHIWPMNALDKYLVDRAHDLVKLLTSPFGKSNLEHRKSRKVAFLISDFGIGENNGSVNSFRTSGWGTESFNDSVPERLFAHADSKSRQRTIRFQRDMQSHESSQTVQLFAEFAQHSHYLPIETRMMLAAMTPVALAGKGQEC